jgi:fibronectin-binding autotransporter adhesin
LTLSAATNAYTGPTNVSAGTLVIAVSGALPKNNSVAVAAGATLIDVANSVLPSMTTAGSLNINGSMIIQNSPSLQTITTAVGQGYNGGTWNGSGPGIISSSAAAADSKHLTALGVIQNDNGAGSPLYSTFEGSGSATLNDSDVLIKYTYYGDTDLNGEVDGTDYSRIDNGCLNNLTGWFNGDFNYDGVINGSDYTLIDNAFNTQGAQISAELASATAQIAGSGTSAVPEPTTLGLLGIGAVGLLGRRRRRH